MSSCEDRASQAKRLNDFDSVGTRIGYLSKRRRGTIAGCADILHFRVISIATTPGLPYIGWMAKAKKTEKPVETKAAATPSTLVPAPEKTAAAVPVKAAKAAAPKAKVAKAASKPAPTSGSTPMVDTGFAAQAAARMLAARANGVIGATNTNQKETSAFKQLKESLAKPHSTSVGNLLNSTSPSELKKSNQHGHKDRQQGHNQTFGSDASKAFVPRRTGGG